MYFKSAKKLRDAIFNRREEEVLRYLTTPAEAKKWTDKYLAYGKKHRWSYTPLLPDVMYAHMDTAARTLIACNVNTTTVEHVDHPFNIATRLGLKYILNTLIEYNVPASKDALYWATDTGNTYTLDRLLAYGVTPTPSSIKGIFGQSNFKDLYNVLVDHGINLSDPMHTGHGYLKTAVYHGNVNAVHFLADFPNLVQDDGAFSLLASNPSSIEMYFILTDKGAEPENIVLQERNTLLHCAVQSKNYALMEDLIKRNINTDATNDMGQTALHIAVAKKDWSAIQMLMNAGASPHILDCRGASPIALEKQQHQPSKLILDLLQGKTEKEDKTAISLKKRQEHSASLVLDLLQAIALKKEATFTDVNTQKDTAWKMLGEDKIAHIETHAEIGKRITDIFNFVNKERMVLTEDLKQGHQGVSPVMSFSEVSFEVLKRAFDIYKSKNGSMSEEEALFNTSGFSMRKPNGGMQP